MLFSSFFFSAGITTRLTLCFLFLFCELAAPTWAANRFQVSKVTWITFKLTAGFFIFFCLSPWFFFFNAQQVHSLLLVGNSQSWRYTRMVYTVAVCLYGDFLSLFFCHSFRLCLPWSFVAPRNVYSRIYIFVIRYINIHVCTGRSWIPWRKNSA